MRRVLIALVVVSAAIAVPRAAASAADRIDQQEALGVSQAAIGGAPGDYTLLDRAGRPVRLSSFRGKPLLVNFVYTGCFHVCPTTTLALHKAVRSMRDRFGVGQFNIVSIGFNQPADSPSALKAFAAQQRIDEPNWDFLSPRVADVAALAHDFGFSYVATPAGFDHILQVTILDARGRIRRQVYGDQFNAAALGEPLKALLAGSILDSTTSLADLLDRARILCSVYDPQTGRYRIDYTLPLEIAGGATFIAVILWLAVAEWRARRLRPQR